MHILKTIITTVISLVALTSISAYGANRMYFGGLVTSNEVSGRMDVMLSWGELEGSIGSEITGFNLYKKQAGGTFIQIAHISNGIMAPAGLRSLFFEDGEETLRDEIIPALNDITSSYEQNPFATNSTNFHSALHDILDPDSTRYNSLQRMLLIRMNRDAARGAGRAHIDRSVAAGIYSYMITATMVNGSETSPLGIVELDTSTETVLPPPTDFVEVRAGACSSSRKNLDHGRVHLNWTVPSTPETMSLQAMTYGYDIFRGEIDLGPQDLRHGIAPGLIRVNNKPIIASGNAPESGADGYLAKDDGDKLYGGVGLPPGSRVYYYLVARDLAGRYSHTAGPLEVVVPDTIGPVTPWNVHGLQEMVWSGNDSIPTMTLTWDRINLVNYLKNYDFEKTICSSNTKQVCYVSKGESCTEAAQLCIDLEVEKYLVYRFTSFERASTWGSDLDGDYWPDELEDLNEDGILDSGETDPCNPLSHPTGFPPQLISEINFNSPAQIRTLDSGKEVQFYRDSVPAPDNRVHWYRIAAIDPYGNSSPLSPPARAALWDRSQPVPSAVVRRKQCEYDVDRLEWGAGKCTPPEVTDKHVILSVIDTTESAAEFEIAEACQGDLGYTYNRIYRGKLVDGRRDVTTEDELAKYIATYSCKVECGKIVVRFFNAHGALLGQSEPIGAAEICDSTLGCIILNEYCKWVDTGDDDTGSTNDPGKNLEICPDLEVGECARIYQRINGEMVQLMKTCRHTAGEDVCRTPEFEGITPFNVCLGVRTFSQNNIGSRMLYLPCQTIRSSPPDPPIMEGIFIRGSESDPEFEVRWSSQGEGMAAYILKIESAARTFYETVWGLKPDPATGQHTYNIPIKNSEIELNWCVTAKAIDNAFQKSGWSSEQSCAVWGEKGEPEYLTWPPVDRPQESAEITAFVLTGERVGVLALSEDLTENLMNWDEPRKCIEETYRVPVCSEKNSCFDSIKFECSICSKLRSWNTIGKFVVYRQEENRDFVQVSPLVEKIHCHSYELWESETWASLLDDPLIYLINIRPGSVTGVSGTIKAELEDSYRLVFADWYPTASGSRVRYKVVKTGKTNSEPEEIFTSNWITLP